MKTSFFLVTAVCLFWAACATSGASIAGISSITSEVFESVGYIDQVTPRKPKDFVTVGMIFVTSSVVLDKNGDIVKGSPITFEMLLKEAEKLGADDIINLRQDIIKTMDTITTVSKTADYLRGRKASSKKATTVTYKATALAIKYKE